MGFECHLVEEEAQAVAECGRKQEHSGTPPEELPTALWTRFGSWRVGGCQQVAGAYRGGRRGGGCYLQTLGCAVVNRSHDLILDD